MQNRSQVNIYLAPMEGVVDWVIRELYSQIGGFDQMVTEFVRVTSRVLPDKVFYRYAPELKNAGQTRAGTPVYVQLLGGDPQVIADNAAAVELLGAPGIDLNFGCPAKTVNRHDGGATLLKNPQRLYDIISAVKSQVKIPVTAKVRLGFADKSLCVDIAQAVNSAKAQRLTIHARTKLEGYKPPAHWHYIAKMKEVCDIPVVANGDIWTLQDYINCKEITGCTEFALGRSAIACPDLALQVKAYEAGEVYQPLTATHVRQKLLPKFVDECMAYKGDHYSVARSKQWTKLLGRQYPEFGELFESIKRKKAYDDVIAVL